MAYDGKYETLKAAGAVTLTKNEDGQISLNQKQFNVSTGERMDDVSEPVDLDHLKAQKAAFQDQIASFKTQTDSLNDLMNDLQILIDDCTALG